MSATPVWRHNASSRSQPPGESRSARSTTSVAICPAASHAVTACQAGTAPLIFSCASRSIGCPSAASRSWASAAGLVTDGVGCTAASPL
ncbi:hypothetical protein, partial [Amycolatopsis magusensis]|uniref:hypothetical protein n=1 Tax=Amycolatopsis magusensis TaxID=882444 RepID=UPI0024A9C743